MRAYSDSSEEARLARDLLHDWRSQGLISPEQYSRMEQETPCDLRRTNIFLRLVLFLFSTIIFAATVGLFFYNFLKNVEDQTIGAFLLIFAAISYAAAELIVSATRLYRYGIEEALLVCSVAFLCIGLYLSTTKDHAEFLVPWAAALVCLWIWYRFGLSYVFLGAMIFLAWLPASWKPGDPAHRTAVAITYLASIGAIAARRAGYRASYLNGYYSIAEALLWFGLYLAVNLQVPGIGLVGLGWRVHQTTAQSSMLFYWTTWVLIWLIPACALIRGLREKDRLVMAAGGITAFLTLLTNKPYLGWPRHTWDPILLGAFLIGLALFIRHWLAQKPNGIRHGLTAQRLSGKDRAWMNIGVTAIGLTAPNLLSAQPPPSTQSPDPQFGGGDSGGAGASSDF